METICLPEHTQYGSKTMIPNLNLKQVCGFGKLTSKCGQQQEFGKY
jgi:hypothetical protein